MARMVLIYSTFEFEKDAQKMAGALLKKKLIGCGVFFPAQSMYWWKGAITAGPETLLLMKTTKSLAVKAKKEIARTHPYEVPCILDWPAGANSPYLHWLMDATKVSKKRKKK